MEPKKLSVISLIFIVLLAMAGSVKSVQTSKCCDGNIIQVKLEGDIYIGEEETIEVCLKPPCMTAAYVVFVFSPGDLECLSELKAKFIDWLKTYDWKDADKFEKDLQGWVDEFKSCDIDVAYKCGILASCDVKVPYKLAESIDECDELVYPGGFKTLVGNPNTDEIGEYDVITVGFCILGCCGCCVCSDSFYVKEHFVIPEFSMGTIVPLLSGLGVLSMLGWITRRKR